MPAHSRHLRRWLVAVLICGLLVSAVSLLEAQPRGGSGRGGFGGGFGGKPLWEPGSILPELRKDEFLKEINFTSEQRDQLEAIRKKVGPSLFEGTEDEKRQKFKDYEAEVLDLLTSDQAQFWEGRKAEILVEAEKDKPKDAAAESKDKPAEALPKSMPRESAPPPEGAKTIVSFATSAEAPDDDGSGPKLAFNFQYAPWTDVLDLFATKADLTLDLKDTPPGTFTYRDNRSYTPTQALDVLNGYLLPRGYLLVRRDRFLVCLAITDGIPPNLAPQISAEELEERGKHELVSLVIPVRGLQADQIIGEVRELLGPQGKASALKNTNSIVVTDIASHVRRINGLLAAESAVDTRDTAFKSIPLKHISANEAERMVRRLFGLNSMSNISQPAAPQWPGPGGPSGGGGFRGGWGGRRGGGDRGDRGEGGGEQDPSQQNPNQGQPTPPPQPAPTAGGSQFANKIHVAADLRTNHLLVTASASLIKVVEDAVRTLDTDTDANGNPLRRVDVPVTYKSYTVPGGDIAVIAQTINQIVPGVVLGQDARSGKLHVEATPDEHERVSQLIQELGGEGSSSVAVIHLQKMDAVQLSNTLLSLFSRDGARAPTVEADPLGRRLIVRGTPDQLLQVKTILAQLGESGDGMRSPSDRGNVRTLTLGGRDPDEILPLLKDAWSASRPNPIRIRIPSRPQPIRDRAVPGAERPLEESEDANEKTAPPVEKPVFRKASLETELQNSETAEAVEDEEEEKEEGSTKGSAPVSMQILGDQLIISSDDPAALDRLEELYERLSAAVPARTKWTVFYLRSADATEAAQMVERLFPQSNVSMSTSASNGGGMLGSLTGGISTLGRGLMNATGLNQTLSASQTLKIVTDLRSNALYVSGPSDQVAEVEQILEVLDSSELPESLRDRLPRTIPVEYADVQEVAEVVEDVFKDAMTPENQGQMPGQRGFNPLMMFMGGGGAAAGPGGRRQPSVQLTVGIDKRTNNLIVSCNESMFQQIESLVRGIDERAKQSRQTVRVVKLDTADPTIVQQTLGSIMPKVTVGTTRRSRRTTPDGSTAAPDNPMMPSNRGPSANGDAMRDAFMQRMMNGGNNNSGGGFNRGTRGGGNFGNREGGGGGRGGGNGGGNGGGGRQRNRSN